MGYDNSYPKETVDKAKLAELVREKAERENKKEPLTTLQLAYTELKYGQSHEDVDEVMESYKLDVDKEYDGYYAYYGIDKNDRKDYIEISYDDNDCLDEATYNLNKNGWGLELTPKGKIYVHYLREDFGEKDLDRDFAETFNKGQYEDAFAYVKTLKNWMYELG